MEDVIGWLLLAVVVLGPIFIMWRLRTNNLKAERESVQAAEKHAQEWVAANTPKRKTRATSQTQTVPSGGVGIQSGGDVNVRMSSSSTVDDLADLATMLVLNAALHHDTAKASVDYGSKEVTVSTSKSDDSSSWFSSSSSSDSGPSFSDSGPSSDW